MVRAALLCLLVACSSTSMPDAPVDPWQLVTHLPVPRLEPGVTAVGTQLVVVGGFDAPQGAHITARVDVYNTLTDQWSQLPDAPVAWTHIQLAAVGSMVYLLGGLEGQQFVARGESFSIDLAAPDPQWVTLPPMPPGFERGSAGVVVIPPRIYLIGGASSTGALASVIYYDITQNAWCPGAACTMTIPDLPAPRSHPAAMVRSFDNAIIVAGGLSGLTSDTQTGDTFLLQPTGTAWEVRAPMLTPRGGCAYGQLRGQLVCAGGEAGMSALSSVESYDSLENMWVPAAMMPEPRAGTQGAAIGQRLWVPGGARRLTFDPTDTVFVFAPLDTTP